MQARLIELHEQRGRLREDVKEEAQLARDARRAEAQVALQAAAQPMQHVE